MNRLQRHDDRAVAPVIGVILMVAITVVLGAVAGIFVFGTGVVDVDPVPQAQFTFADDDSVTDATFDADGCAAGSFDGSNVELTVTHNGGGTIDADRLTIRGAEPSDPAFHECSAVSSGERVMAQDTAHVEAASDDVVRVVWMSADERNSQTLATWNGTAET